MKIQIGFAFFLLFSCSEGSKSLDSEAPRNGVDFFISKGLDQKKLYSIRRANADTAYCILKTYSNSKVTREKLFKLCSIYDEINESTFLLRCARTARVYACKDSDSLDAEKSEYYIARAHMHRSVNDSAFFYINRCLKSSKRRSEIKPILLYTHALTSLHYYTCDYVSVEKSATDILRYARQKYDREYEWVAFNWLAISATELGEYDKATDYYNQALILVKSNSYHRSHTLHSKGFNYYRAGKLHLAIDTYLGALSQMSIDIYPEVYTRLLDDLAHARFKLGKREFSPNVYFRSERIRDSFNVDAGRNFNKLYLSEYYSAIGDTSNAKLAAFEALKISENYRASKDKLAVLRQLINIDKIRTAEFSNEYIALSDSLQLAERKNRNKFARIAFETDDIVKEKNRVVKQKWIISSVASGLLLLLTLLFIIRLQRAKQKELILVQRQQKADESIYQLINDQQLKVDEGRQAEKKRIAQELHDGIMNRLASTRLNLFILNKNQDPPTINRCLGFINNIQDIEKEIRQVAHDLNQEIFSENQGFALLLETLFEGYRNIGETRLFTEIDPAFNWEMTESVLRMHIYRMLQEALHNSFKYANARNIFVTLTREDDFVRILVHDDGTGFDPQKVKKGIGLKSIADRAATLNGEFKIISGRKEGTILNILLPLSKK